MNNLKFDHILRQVLLVPIFAVLLGAAAVYWQMHDANRMVDQVEISDANITRSLLVEQLFVDHETGLRGFQATHDPEFLEPYTSSEETLNRFLARMKTDAAGDAQRSALIDDLQAANDSWHQGFAVPLIATVRAGGRTDDRELNLVGKSQMDHIRSRFADLIALEQKRRAEQETAWHRQTRHMSLALLVLALVVGGVIGLYTRNLIRDLSSAFRRSNHSLRVRAEEAFRSEQRLRTTLSSIGDGVITCNADGLVEGMNPVAQSLTGWTESEAFGSRLEDVFYVIDESSRQRVEDPAAKVKRMDAVVGMESHSLLVRRDKSEIHINDSGAPIRDKSGALMGIVLVFRDVSLARKSQDALLANEKLAVAGRLAATIAHEIHNPLDSVSNLLFLMDGKCSPEESSEFLRLAKSEINRVTQISRAMLSLYREAKAPIPVDIKVILESILLLLESRFLTLGVHTVTQLPDGLVILGFPAELRQVFTNLLINAAEATGTGGVVRVIAEFTPSHQVIEGAPGQPGVCIVVEDEGPGIPPDIREKLFQPFFTTKGEQGTGLGLWVSRGIISKHGGSISLESSTDPDDHGTTVSVFLASDPVLQVVPEESLSASS